MAEIFTYRVFFMHIRVNKKQTHIGNLLYNCKIYIPFESWREFLFVLLTKHNSTFMFLFFFYSTFTKLFRTSDRHLPSNIRTQSWHNMVQIKSSLFSGTLFRVPESMVSVFSRMFVLSVMEVLITQANKKLFIFMHKVS